MSYDMNPKEQVSSGPRDIYSHQLSVLLIDLLKYVEQLSADPGQQHFEFAILCL